MTHDPCDEIRGRFRATRLPPAPVRLRERLAAIASSSSAATTSRSGRARLVLALAAVFAVASIGLLGGGGANDPSPSPHSGAWGPLAVANLVGMPAARTEGTLELTDRCAFLVDLEGVRQVVVWPADRTSWDPQTQTVTLRRLQATETVELRGGDQIEFGGGGSSLTEGGPTGEEWVVGFDWVSPPATECLTDTRWVLSDAGLLVAEATPGPAPMQIVCREGEPPAYTCAAVIDAVLATVGPDRPIELLEVGRLCRTRNPCEAMATVIVEVTFAPPDERLVRLIVNPGPDGPVAYFIEPEPGSTKPPQIGPTSEPREQRFNLAYGTEPPAGELTPIYEVELSDDRETLTVIFYGGGGYAGSPCGESDYEPWIGLEGNDLIVGIYVVDRPNRTFPPAPSGLVHACIMVAYPHTYYLTLAGGFAGTKVRDLKSQTFEVDAP